METSPWQGERWMVTRTVLVGDDGREVGNVRSPVTGVSKE